MKVPVQEAIILAAGEGTRLRPLTYRRPKVLIPVAGSPFLDHQLHLLSSAGVRRVVLVVGHMKETLGEWVEGNPRQGMEIDLCVQKSARGTGDAINAARGKVAQRFMVINGDVLIDRESMVSILRSESQSVAAKRVGNPRDYGVFDTEGGRVTRVVEKADDPPSNLANVGVYVFDPDIFDRIDSTPPNPKRNEVEITDTLQGMIDSGEEILCHQVSKWYELGKPWDIPSLNEALLPRVVEGSPGSRGPDGVITGAGTEIEKGARVLGPSIIGRGCRISRGTVVGPFTSVGSSSVLDGCICEGSVIMDGCKIGRGSSISHSVLGPGCRIGLGVVVMDRHASGDTVRMEVKGSIMDSGRRKLGCVLGDGCILEDGSVLPPGALLDPGSLVARSVR